MFVNPQMVLQEPAINIPWQIGAYMPRCHEVGQTLVPMIMQTQPTGSLRMSRCTMTKDKPGSRLEENEISTKTHKRIEEPHSSVGSIFV